MQPDQLVFLWFITMSVSICAVIFGMRYMRNKENMAMIEKGLDPNIKPERPRPAPFRNLKWGLLLVGAGLGLFLAYLLDNTVLYKVGHYVGHWSGGIMRLMGPMWLYTSPLSRLAAAWG
jgi:hypothetical protein